MTVISLGAGSHEPRLSKKQLACVLGYSTRWVDLRVAEGMPWKPASGQKRFLLSEVEAWLQARAASPPPRRRDSRLLPPRRPARRQAPARPWPASGCWRA